MPATFSPSRLEALADGVFAIAITLLILEIRLPGSPDSGELGQALRALWPSYLGYVTSFVIIGIMWMNHHTIFRLIERVDHTFIVLNLLLLLFVAFVPFPTRVLAEHLRDRDGQATATAFHTGTFTLIGIIFNLLWRYAAHGRSVRAGRTADRS